MDYLRKIEKALTEREKRIRMLESTLIKSKLENELNRRGALSANLVAEYLAPFVRWDGQKMIVVDEEGKKRVKAVKGEDGRVYTEEMSVGDLVEEFLGANPHLLPQEEPESESEEEDIEARYRAALEESRRRGRPTGEMLKWMVKRYSK